MHSSLPVPTVRRLTRYHCALSDLLEREPPVETITSRRLAAVLGLKNETVRRDISFIDAAGRPGVGYDVRELRHTCGMEIGADSVRPTMLVGRTESLRAFDTLFPFKRLGFDPVSVFTTDRVEEGNRVCGIPALPIESITMDVARGARIAVFCDSEPLGQHDADLLVSAGARAILAVSSAIQAQLPDDVCTEALSVACDMRILACRADVG